MDKQTNEDISFSKWEDNIRQGRTDVNINTVLSERGGVIRAWVGSFMWLDVNYPENEKYLSPTPVAKM